MSDKLTVEGMRQFTGTNEWFRHALNPDILYTDGARYVAEAGGAYWLLDEIALANQYESSVIVEHFQVWTLYRYLHGSGAVLKCEDGNNNVVYTKNIEYTDFPLQKVELWCEGFMTRVILLPSEH